MATVRDPVKPEPVAKYETLVESKLAQARGRIRALDLTAAFLGFVIATMAFGLVMVLLDRWFHLSTLFRQIAFSVYGVAALAYLGRVVAWPLFRRVNPYYAAIQVEHTLPAAKNSVVNWLDLRQQSLPPAIKGAVSHRAALDISRADLDEAVNPRQVLWLGGAATALFLIVLGLALFGPGLGRVFQPFSPANRTELVIVKPDGGNATVSVGRAVSFEVAVQGRRPDSLRLLYRYEQSVPYEERPMEVGDSAGQWLLTMPAFEVKNGFWYKVAGGDAETEEYRVQVRPTPLITGFEVTYQHRPYTRLPNVTSADPNLKGLRGTAVQLVARTNRKIRYDRSGLVFSDASKDSIPAEPVPGNPQAMQFRLVLDKDGSYLIRFISDEGESNTDPISYSIKVEPDQPPVVVLTRPEEEMISLPANEVLLLEGSANDDFGITGFILRMQTNPTDGSPKEPLPPKPYRPGKSFRFPDGSYPSQLDYKDFVELNKVRQGNGQPLQPGMVMEYWLEATDNCDFPAANVGRSRSKFVTIVEPAKDQEQVAKQKKQAKEKQQQHEAQQDKQLEQQGQGQEGPPQADGNPQAQQGEGQGQNKDGNPQARQGDSQDQKQEGNPQARPGEQKNEGNPQAGQGGSQDQNREGNPQALPGEGKNKDADLKRVQQQLENQLERQQAAEGKNADQGNPQPNKDNQGEGQPKPDENQPGKPQPDRKDGQPGAKNGPEKERPDKRDEQNKDAEGDAGKAPPKPGDKNRNEKPAPDDKQGPQKGAGQPKEGGGTEPKDEKVKKNEDQNNLKPKENSEEGKKNREDKARTSDPTNIKGNPKASDKQPKKEDGQGGKGKDQEGPDGPKDKTKPDPAQNQNNNPGKGSEAKDAGKKPPQPGANPDAGPDKAKNPKPGQDNKAPGKDEQLGKDPGQPNKDKGKPGDQGKPNPQAEPGKPKEGDGHQPGEGQPPMDKGANKPGSDNKDGQKEIDNLAKQMKSGDPKAREEARKKLEDLSKNAKEESDRKAAGECLKGNSGSNGKKEGQGAGPGENKAGKEGQEASAGKPGDTPDKKDQNRQGGQPGAKGEGANDQKGAQSKESGKGEAGKQPGKPGSNPSGSTQGDRWDPANQGSNAEAELGAEANKEFQKRAGVMQLEEAKKRLKELKEKANDEFLKKADVSKGELLDYLKHEEERLQRLEAQLKQDKALNPKRGGGTLPNLRVRRVQSGEKKDDLPHANNATAPPELREASEEFNQLIAKPERSKDKR